MYRFCKAREPSRLYACTNPYLYTDDWLKFMQYDAQEHVMRMRMFQSGANYLPKG
jgi:hypothetical protein